MPRALSTGAVALFAIAAGACAEPPPEYGEQQRLREHFAAVDAELARADVSHLSAAQRAARARHIATLQRYSQRGRFPHNHDFAAATPYFVDSHGTHCALAFLIAESGHGDLVASIAATRNNARVDDLAGDPRLVAWLEQAGLSAAEAARIQPLYECPGWPDCPDDEEIDGDYALAGGVSMLASGIAIGMNFPSVTPKWRGWLALGTGAAGLYIGAQEVESDRTMGLIARVTLASGLVAVVMGGKTLLTSPDDDDRAASQPPGIAVTPILGGDGGGLAISGSF